MLHSQQLEHMDASACVPNLNADILGQNPCILK